MHQATLKKTMVTLKKKTSYQRSWRAAEMQSEIALGVSKKNKHTLNTRKTKMKEQKTTLDSAFLVSASEKSLSDNYHTLYYYSRKPM